MTRREFLSIRHGRPGHADRAGPRRARRGLYRLAAAQEGARRIVQDTHEAQAARSRSSRSFAIIEERRDAWVKYPREPVGSVWLIRQPDGRTNGDRAVVGMPAPGMRGQPDGRRQEFHCPCHTSAFDLDGTRKNPVRPATWTGSRSSSPREMTPRAELPGGHQQREVPRDDLPDHAERLAQRVGVEVRRPACTAPRC